MNYIKVFWPVILYVVVFASYIFMVIDFFSDSMRFLAFHLPCMITNLFVLPAIAAVQLIYAIYKLILTKQRHYWLHIVSALAVFGLLIIFFLLANLGLAASV